MKDDMVTLSIGEKIADDRHSDVKVNDDHNIDWTTDGIDYASDMMSDEINHCDIQDILDSIDMLEDGKCFGSGCKSNIEESFATPDVSEGVQIETSVGQPTSESNDKTSTSLRLHPLLFDINDVNDIDPMDKCHRHIMLPRCKGPSHRSAKKKSKGIPKRPLSAYNLFFQSERLTILDEALRNHERVTFESLAKIIGQRWHDLQEVEVAKFKTLAQEDIVRYRQEMKRYHIKNRNQSSLFNDGEIDVGEKVTRTPRTPRSPSTPKKRCRRNSDASTSLDIETSSPPSKLGATKVLSELGKTHNQDCIEGIVDGNIKKSSPKLSGKHPRCTKSESSPQEMESGNSKEENTDMSDKICSLPIDLSIPTLIPSSKPFVNSLPQPLVDANPPIIAIPIVSKKYQKNGSKQLSFIPIKTIPQPNDKDETTKKKDHDDRIAGNSNLTSHEPSYDQTPRNHSTLASIPWHTPVVYYPMQYQPSHYYDTPFPVPHPQGYPTRGYGSSIRTRHGPSIPIPTSHLPHNNQEVVIHGYRYRIQYKCYAMKRSDANSYMSQFSSPSIFYNNYHQHQNHHPYPYIDNSSSSSYRIPVEQLVLRHPLPYGAVEVDMEHSGSSMPSPPRSTR